ELGAWAVANPRRHGIRTLRHVIEQTDPASESPMESRLRMLLVLDGLPRPRAQVNIGDSHGTFLGRVDLYYDVERSASSTTAPRITIRWLLTTAARIACFRRAFVCFGSPPATYVAILGRWSGRCARC